MLSKGAPKMYSISEKNCALNAKERNQYSIWKIVHYAMVLDLSHKNMASLIFVANAQTVKVLGK